MPDKGCKDCGRRNETHLLSIFFLFLALHVAALWAHCLYPRSYLFAFSQCSSTYFVQFLIYELEPGFLWDLWAFEEEPNDEKPAYSRRFRWLDLFEQWLRTVRLFFWKKIHQALLHFFSLSKKACSVFGNSANVSLSKLWSWLNVAGQWSNLRDFLPSIQ